MLSESQEQQPDDEKEEEEEGKGNVNKMLILENMRLIYQNNMHVNDINDNVNDNNNLCLIIKNNIISHIIHKNHLLSLLLPLDSSQYDIIDCQNNIVSPGFIDVQVYGSGGRLFGTYPDERTLLQMEQDLVQQGTTGFLATIATNTLDIFEKGFQATHCYNKSEQFIGNFWGVHLEGPYISQAKRGAHPVDCIREATVSEVKTILSQAKGTLKAMTIAPEEVSEDIQQLLVDEKVVLSCGHSNASLSQGNNFLANNLVTAVTHLYNAMPSLYHRPGSVGYIPSVFTHRPYTSIVVDGVHVDYSMVQLAKRELNDKLFLITDAVTETKEGVYPHSLHIEKNIIECESGGKEEVEEIRKYVMPDGTLSGSALTMLLAVKNCVRHCDIPLCEAIKMATLYPARMLGVDQSKGLIEIGYDADICVFDDNFEVVSTFIKGKAVFNRLKGV